LAESRRQRFSTEPIPAGRRVACQLEYDGRGFNGWQAQPHPGVRTVQQVLEHAMQRVANAPMRVHCAGRTDTGVHGFAQVIHFETPVERSSKAWVMGSNSYLPEDVTVHWAHPVPDDFHARFSALSRRYRYVVANTVVRPALLAGLVTWYRAELDAERMEAAAQALLGEQDFSAFRAASCQSSSPMRNVHRVRVLRRDDLIIFDIQANAFLHHMVRNIVGALLLVGNGRKAVGWIAQLLQQRDRTQGADTAPADGLYLMDVEYPRHFELPAGRSGSSFLFG